MHVVFLEEKNLSFINKFSSFSRNFILRDTIKSYNLEGKHASTKFQAEIGV